MVIIFIVGECLEISSYHDPVPELRHVFIIVVVGVSVYVKVPCLFGKQYYTIYCIYSA